MDRGQVEHGRLPGTGAEISSNSNSPGDTFQQKPRNWPSVGCNACTRNPALSATAPLNAYINIVVHPIMSTDTLHTATLQPFTLEPDSYYPIDLAARLAQMPRHRVLVCCKRGF